MERNPSPTFHLCGTINRTNSVFCKKCGQKFITSCNGKKCYTSRESPPSEPDSSNDGSCTHESRTYDHDQPHFYYYPIWVGIMDCFAHVDSEYLNTLSVESIAACIQYCSENNIISSLTSLNSISAYTRLGLHSLANLAKSVYTKMNNLNPRAFLHVDSNSSFEHRMSVASRIHIPSLVERCTGATKASTQCSGACIYVCAHN